MATHDARELDTPSIYSLDRRGPNDPPVGSVHVVLAVLIAVLALGVLLVV